MTGRRHRSNCELVAQGVANIGSALFGGICVTGTIARTATNVRAGARGPVAGMLHSLFLLLFMLIAAPLASYIPLAALAAVLAVVAWNMAEKHEFATLLRSSRGDAVVLLATFLLTIFRDLTEGILVGFALGAVLFIHRMAQMTGIEAARAAGRRRPGRRRRRRSRALRRRARHRSRRAWSTASPARSSSARPRPSAPCSTASPTSRKAFVIDFAAVPFLDSTAANAMGRVAAKAQRQGIRLFITGASPAVRRALLTHGVSAAARAAFARRSRVRSPTSRSEQRRGPLPMTDGPRALTAAHFFKTGRFDRRLPRHGGRCSGMLDSRRNIALACALSALAGYVDGIGFLHLGGLFVSFMSGNSTRMGVSLAEAHWWHAAEALGLIVLFVAGAAAGSLIVLGRRRRSPALAAADGGRCCLRPPRFAMRFGLSSARDRRHRAGDGAGERRVPDRRRRRPRPHLCHRARWSRSASSSRPR